MNTSKCTLVGGQSHGQKIEILDSVDSVEVPVYADFDDHTTSIFYDTYTRRQISMPAGEENLIYFGHTGDDDTEIEALARRLRSESENPTVH